MLIKAPKLSREGTQRRRGCWLVYFCTTKIINLAPLILLFLSLCILPGVAVAANHDNTNAASIVINSKIDEPSSLISTTSSPNIINAGSNGPTFLNAVVLVASVNILLNALRPDPFVTWQVRFILALF